MAAGDTVELAGWDTTQHPFDIVGIVEQVTLTDR